MDSSRSAGILCHPTSFPGAQGMGSLGAEARAFIDWLTASGIQLWQVLPLGPPGYGGSPYACKSAIAGNPLLIDLTELAQMGWLGAADVPMPGNNPDGVDFGEVEKFKLAALRAAFERFYHHGSPREKKAFEAFCSQPENQGWLDDYALFSAIKDAHGGAQWVEWEPALMARNPAALHRFMAHHEKEVDFHRFMQWIFAHQWGHLRRYAHERGVQIVGDIPIFMAFDSCDVWANPTLFLLDDRGQPTHVAGVPPDYFSETGQLWGNPLYRWDVMRRTGYRWWIERFRGAFRQVDSVRVDHFRGFAAYWAIPHGDKTAVNGRWVQGPGKHFFAAIREALGELPIIAEDLGDITPDVHELRDHFGLPGMKILQFAFGGGHSNAFLPHNYPHPNWVVYTGTHDNDTTLGWWNALAADSKERKEVLGYLGLNKLAAKKVPDALMRLAWMSTARVAIAPLQDVLALPTSARMNMPGKEKGNWGWRYKAGDLTAENAAHLRELSATYGRLKGAAR